jgi:hypothetical protein
MFKDSLGSSIANRRLVLGCRASDCGGRVHLVFGKGWAESAASTEIVGGNWMERFTNMRWFCFLLLGAIIELRSFSMTVISGDSLQEFHWGVEVQSV